MACLRASSLAGRQTGRLAAVRQSGMQVLPRMQPSSAAQLSTTSVPLPAAGCYFCPVLLEPAFADDKLGRFLVEERIRPFLVGAAKEMGSMGAGAAVWWGARQAH